VHNVRSPQVLRHTPSGEFLLFHVGKGDAPPSLAKPTSSALRSGVGAVSDGSGFMHHSSSVDGPWLPAATSPGGCDMPCAAFHPNGTLFAVCRNGRSLAHTVDATTDPWDVRDVCVCNEGHGDRFGLVVVAPVLGPIHDFLHF
jgi:hypothetical protein